MAQSIGPGDKGASCENTLLFNLGFIPEVRFGSVPTKRRIPRSRAAGFTGKLMVFDLLLARACMHAPGTPGRNADGQAWTRYPGTMQTWTRQGHV